MSRVAVLATVGITLFGLVYSLLKVNLGKSASPVEYFSLAILSAFVLCVLRFYLTKYILEPIGEAIIKDTSAARTMKVPKFGSCVFKAGFFLVISYFEYLLLSNQDFTPSWLFGSGNTVNLWTENYVMPVDLISVFMGSLGYHLHSTVYHCFFVDRRGDFGEMLLHHALTLWLMVLSYIEGYSRIGLLIVFLNDVPDIFVYLTKTLGDTPYVKASIASYIGLVVSYFYFRLVVFPVSLLPSLLYESNFTPTGRVLYIGFLGSLTLLHAYWFALIVRIGINIATRGSRRDITVDRKKSNYPTNLEYFICVVSGVQYDRTIRAYYMHVSRARLELSILRSA